MRLNICDLGKMEYTETLKIQETLLYLRQREMIEDTLLLVEHPSVLTIGRSSKECNVLIPKQQLENYGVKIYEVNRGGDITYHGPGQIVGYPILNLNNHGKDIRLFLENIENVIIRLLHDEYGIKAHRGDKKYTGIWVGEEKITAIGISIKRWVTMHGFAFNVNTNLDHFKWIIPCGISEKGVTSLQKLTKKKQDLEKINIFIARYFCEVFKMQPLIKKVEDLVQDSL
ncbi:lipoyl(octanoyl) transferase LipB [Alkalibaculum sp. M08DMB]|uniref:Octanoyltransferase n=1 Tax=Alkalibaculum sporogenes TaxID=2655001 RepID=A0A6A7KBZ2_9FIRM|nr:lipoyl(octanoyl) transferase LipB [Alkalibaculum sporogenes]MPW26533.1 lipoyl(octanoyl) transferase LipB [Alkalibaculum sporogenes]